MEGETRPTDRSITRRDTTRNEIDFFPFEKKKKHKRTRREAGDEAPTPTAADLGKRQGFGEDDTCALRRTGPR
jgi:hypothetical protein